MRASLIDGSTPTQNLSRKRAAVVVDLTAVAVDINDEVWS